MPDSIIFLGTGGDISVVGKQQRASGGIIVKVGETQLHIDPGPSALRMAQTAGVNVRENTAILVSQNRSIHAAGANEVISAMTHNGLDKQGVLIANESTLKGDLISSFHKGLLEKTISLAAGKKAAVEDIEIQALKTIHTDPSTIGFKLLTPKFVLTYTSDTTLKKEIIDQYKKSDILIINCVHPFGTKPKDSLCSDCAVRIIKQAQPKLAVLTHFGSRMLAAKPLYESREIQKQTGIQVVAAEDGMHIDPMSYSAQLKQKTLRSF